MAGNKAKVLIVEDQVITGMDLESTLETALTNKSINV